MAYGMCAGSLVTLYLLNAFVTLGYAQAMVQVVRVTTGEELQAVVNGGANHTLVTDHVDMRGLDQVDCPYEMLVSTSSCMCIRSGRVDVVTIQGDCGTSFKPQDDMIVTLPPFFPGQCVVRVINKWLMASDVKMWVHNLHILYGPRAFSDVFLLFILNADVWATQFGLQGDGQSGTRGAYIHTSQKETTKVLFQNSFFGDTRSYSGSAIFNHNSTVAMSNVTFQRTVGFATSPRKGAVLSYDWQTPDFAAKTLCVDFDADDASHPVFGTYYAALVYTLPKADVWNVTAQRLEQSLHPSTIPDDIQFPSINDADLVAVQQALNGTAAAEPPSPAPAPEQTPPSFAPSPASLPPSPASLPGETPLPSAAPPVQVVPPPPPLPDSTPTRDRYQPDLSFNPDATIVNTNKDLQNAFADGARVVVISDHLDMTSLSVMRCGALACVGTTTYSVDTTVSVQGNCTSTFTGTLDGTPMPVLFEGQCVAIVHATWMIIQGITVWVHNVYVVVQSPTAVPVEVEALIRLKNSANVYFTSVGLQGNGIGTQHLLYVHDSKSKCLFQDGVLANAGGGNSTAPGIWTYGSVALNHTTVMRVIPNAFGAAIVTDRGGILCTDCRFDAWSLAPLGVWTEAGRVYSDVQTIVLILITGQVLPSKNATDTSFDGFTFLNITDTIIVTIIQIANGSQSTPVGLIVGTSMGLLAALLCTAVVALLLRKRRKVVKFVERIVSSPAPKETEYDVFLTHEWAGQDGMNHARVQRVHESLLRLGVASWFDGDEMQGDIHARMAEGIEASAGVLVFLTQRYHDKVVGTNAQDNCKFEFDIAINSKLGSLLAVVMEDEMLDTRKWHGKMSAIAMKLYVSLVKIDSLSDDELDRYLQETLIPQMTWISK